MRWSSREDIWSEWRDERAERIARFLEVITWGRAVKLPLQNTLTNEEDDIRTRSVAVWKCISAISDTFLRFTLTYREKQRGKLDKTENRLQILDDNL